jgi:membrane dipeptidase
MTDIPRLRAGRVRAVLVGLGAVELKGATRVQVTLEQIDLVKRMAASIADFEMAYTAADVLRIHRSGRSLR